MGQQFAKVVMISPAELVLDDNDVGFIPNGVSNNIAWKITGTAFPLRVLDLNPNVLNDYIKSFPCDKPIAEICLPLPYLPQVVKLAAFPDLHDVRPTLRRFAAFFRLASSRRCWRSSQSGR
jgi:hypothetical protein